MTTPLRKLAKSLVFDVTVLHPGGDHETVGHAVMKHRADRATMERELSGVGVYAPRGLDRVFWGVSGATIRDGEGHAIVKLKKVNTYTLGNKGRPVMPPGTREA